MNVSLESNAYGKNAIRLSRIARHDDRHEIRHIGVNVSLEGDFEEVHTIGDNRKVLPTDTMKNTVYALAKEHFTTSIEAFGRHLSGHFLSRNPQVSSVRIDLEEYTWTRMIFNGRPHPHAFLDGGSAKHTASILTTRDDTTLSSGIKDLLLLKTTDSGFENYIKDEYTTLKETSDRIFSTQCEISWTHISPSPETDYEKQYQDIRLNLLQTFADHKSLSVQHTLYAMGENLLAAFGGIGKVSLKMPNKHHIPFNLQQFGMNNDNEVFIATDEPFGYITGTITRK